MTRIIKFREWDGQKMSQVNVLCENARTNDGQLCLQSALSELMQFTGLLDKFGKEIYEGDILGYWATAKWVVGWNENKACYAAVYSKEDFKRDKELQSLVGKPLFALSKSSIKGKEIIGNIYEHPDLLDKSKEV